MKYIIAILLAGVVISSCQKASYVSPAASVIVVHAMPSGNAIVPLFGSQQPGQYYKSLQQIRYGGSSLFPQAAGMRTLQVVPITDTGFNIFQANLSFNSGAIYSLFFAGDTAHVDTVLTVDNIPYYTDSSTGARFIHLVSGGSPALSVNIAGGYPSSQEWTSLGYKQITSFKKYAATKAAGSSYIFEIRDAANGTLYSTYTWRYTRFKNQTIVIAGAATSSLRIFTVNNY